MHDLDYVICFAYSPCSALLRRNGKRVNVFGIFKPPPTQNCHPDEGRIPSETQSHVMRVKVFLLAHNVLEKPTTFSARTILCDLLRLFALLGSPSSKWQACVNNVISNYHLTQTCDPDEGIRYFQATSHTNLSS